MPSLPVYGLDFFSFLKYAEHSGSKTTIATLAIVRYILVESNMFEVLSMKFEVR